MSFLTWSWGPGLVIFIGLIISAIGGVWSYYQTDKFNVELRAKAEENARMSRELAALTTGGNSFAYVSIGPLDKDDIKSVVLVQQGKYPLYDLQVRSHTIGDPLPTTFEDIKKLTVWKIGSLPPESAVIMKTLDLSNMQEYGANYFFAARNGHFIENLRGKKLDGKWYFASRVIDSKENTIFEKVDEGYPRLENGMVEW